MVLERLSGPDFMPCKDDSSWSLPSVVLEHIADEISNLVPQLQIPYQSLPYIMATYKMHKNKYRWLTNAFHTVYSNVAHLLTIASMAVLEKVRDWASSTVTGYGKFLGCQTSIYWLVNSSIEVAINLPENIEDIFVADITRCYESIPLQGPDNLTDAVAHVMRIGYRQARATHSRVAPVIWIRVDSEGNAVKATWNTNCPSYGSWFSLQEEQLVDIHRWLMNNCYVTLGDRVWKQKLGIPMGFSCSPLWCNTYLMHYEIKFIQRLASLGRSDLMKRFKTAFRYIDDLCWVNTASPMENLSPSQIRSVDNPYWIYPLDVLEIKCEVSKYSDLNPTKGIQANFMNL